MPAALVAVLAALKTNGMQISVYLSNGVLTLASWKKHTPLTQRAAATISRVRVRGAGDARLGASRTPVGRDVNVYGV